MAEVELVSSGQSAVSVVNDAKKSFGMSIIGSKQGVFKVQALRPDGLAAQAGVKMRDVLLSVDGVPVGRRRAFCTAAEDSRRRHSHLHCLT